MKAKILVYDLETMAERGWYFPPRYETNILHVDHFTHLLSFAYKWLGERSVHVLALDDFKGYNKDKHNDYELTKALHALLNDCDMSIGHNATQFDDKIALARIIYHKLPPISPRKVMDTKKMAKVARFSSNKLDDLGAELGEGRKVKHGDFEELWIGCDEGNPKAWKVMKKYNKYDVVLDERLYLRLRPYIHNHPSLALIDGIMDGCPKCKSTNMTKKGFKYTTVGKKQQYQCQDCGGWATGRKIIKTELQYI
jgi:hypothetical protein